MKLYKGLYIIFWLYVALITPILIIHPEAFFGADVVYLGKVIESDMVVNTARFNFLVLVTAKLAERIDY